MRLFVALNLPPEERERIYGAAAPLRREGLPVRWTREHALHLTLRFLGEVEPDALEDLERAIAAAAAIVTPFTMRLGGSGAFPSLSRPRVLWVGVDAAPELLTLHAALERELAPLGFAPEPGPFRPHLTLGRVRRGAALRGTAALLGEIHFAASLQVSEFELMRSHLTPEGSRYELLRTFPLG